MKEVDKALIPIFWKDSPGFRPQCKSLVIKQNKYERVEHISQKPWANQEEPRKQAGEMPYKIFNLNEKLESSWGFFLVYYVSFPQDISGYLPWKELRNTGTLSESANILKN